MTSATAAFPIVSLLASATQNLDSKDCIGWVGGLAGLAWLAGAREFPATILWQDDYLVCTVVAGVQGTVLVQCMHTSLRIGPVAIPAGNLTIETRLLIGLLGGKCPLCI